MTFPIFALGYNSVCSVLHNTCYVYVYLLTFLGSKHKSLSIKSNAFLSSTFGFRRCVSILFLFVEIGSVNI